MLRVNKYNKQSKDGILKPENLPAAGGAARQHSLRAYLQLQDWLILQSMSRDPKEYGWYLTSGGAYEPILITDAIERKKLHKEDKEIYLCGDFNIDLLKLETISVYQYYNLLCSYGFLPHIIQPTRIVENQIPSVIDNIFSNNICEEITAGNIFIMFSEHLSQFYLS